MAAVHTQARGTEPYDKVYCLGYQVHHEDWSPYPRINRLRQTFLDRGYDVDVERLRLVTQSYRQHEHLPEKLKVAYAFERAARWTITSTSGWTTTSSRAPKPGRKFTRPTSTTTRAPAIWRWITPA